MRQLAGTVRQWWSQKWIWAAAYILGSAIVVVAGLAWKLAARPVNGTEGLILQEQMLIAVVQSGLAFAVAMAAMQSSRLATRKERADGDKQRRGVVLALVGSAIECAGYAGWLAAAQRFGLKRYRKPLPESPAQREFTIAAWRSLAASAAAVPRALITVTYEDSVLLHARKSLTTRW